MLIEKYGGARIYSIHFGLVADLTYCHPFNSPYYLRIDIQKGLGVWREFFPAKDNTLDLNVLGKTILTAIGAEDFSRLTFTFTDGSSWIILAEGNEGYKVLSAAL